MPVEWILALRYLKPKRGKGIISFVAFVSVFGVMLGVGAIIVVVSLMNGFDYHIRKGIVESNPQIYIMSFKGFMDESEIKEIMQKLENVGEIKAVTPFLLTQALIKANGVISGVTVKGVDPKRETEVTNIDDMVKIGEWECIKKRRKAILGKELADQVGLLMDSGFTIILPVERVTPFGFLPRMSSLEVCGLFDTGIYSQDSMLVVVSLETLQSIMGMKGKYTGLEVSIKDVYKAVEVSEKIEKLLGYPYWTNNWISMNKPLFSALTLEKYGMFLVLTLIVLVASFSIVSTLTMTVMDKSKDIAILAAMGMTRNRIVRIFLYQGIIMGVTGIVLGLILGLGLCAFIPKFKIIELPEIYYVNRLPVKVNVFDVILTCLSAFVIVLTSSYFPAKRAGKLSPVEILRYE